MVISRTQGGAVLSQNTQDKSQGWDWGSEKETSIEPSPEAGSSFCLRRARAAWAGRLKARRLHTRVRHRDATGGH